MRGSGAMMKRGAMVMWLLPIVAGLLSGCSGGPALFQSNTARADSAARAANPPLSKTRFETRQFDLVGYYRQSAPNDPRLAVFIEGDGLAYVTRTQRAVDPTPEKPVALDLAARDKAPNLLYLARPCQYVGGRDGRNCDSAYWTTHRYAPEVVAALDEAISQYVGHFGATQLALHGYSGGGQLALLLAGQRSDVASVVTIAGVLDHQAWTSHFGDTPLYGSRNSLEVAERLRNLPQRHFIGLRDDQVPPELAPAFLRRLGLPPEKFITQLPRADHECCWAELWPQLSQQGPVKP